MMFRKKYILVSIILLTHVLFSPPVISGANGDLKGKEKVAKNAGLPAIATALAYMKF